MAHLWSQNSNKTKSEVKMETLALRLLYGHENTKYIGNEKSFPGIKISNLF